MPHAAFREEDLPIQRIIGLAYRRSIAYWDADSNNMDTFTVLGSKLLESTPYFGPRIY